MSPEEPKDWTAAVDYYDTRLASKDLLFDDGMYAIKMAIADGDLSRPAIGAVPRPATKHPAATNRTRLM